MDIVSHGLWGSVLYGRKSRTSYWLAFLSGIGPDFFAFAPFFFSVLIGLRTWPHFDGGHPENADIMPQYIHQLYNFTHSLVIFAVIFAVLWLVFRRPIWEFTAWGLHIIMDIPFHSTGFFPTPFAWPISNVHVNGIPWSHPAVFIPNVIGLAIAYYFYFRSRKRA